MKNRSRFWERWGNWELWPFTLIYAPLGPLWLYYAARARAFWWFTPANPTLTFAGFEGEGKREMYEQLPEHLYPTTIYIEPTDSFAQVQAALANAGLHYPLCVKPQVGLKGLLFRKVDNEAALQSYHSRVPVSYLIQTLVDLPLEVSVFYYRFPNQKKGTITGFIQKDMMQVQGDGRRSLRELIEAHPKARHRMAEMEVKHAENLGRVLPEGERYVLTHAANLNRGARFTNLQQHIDDRLLAIFDPLSHRCKWYYGRYDIKCESIDALKEGRFSILEFNGAGAEPNHVYHAGCTWFQALRVFAKHWQVLFKIARYNHRHQGVRYWGNREGYTWMQQAGAHGDLLEKYDREIII